VRQTGKPISVQICYFSFIGAESCKLFQEPAEERRSHDSSRIGYLAPSDHCNVSHDNANTLNRPDTYISVPLKKK
jgi:hypothetical protein